MMFFLTATYHVNKVERVLFKNPKVLQSCFCSGADEGPLTP